MKKTTIILSSLTLLACLSLISCADKTCSCTNYVAGMEMNKQEIDLGDHDDCKELSELTITDSENKTGVECE